MSAGAARGAVPAVAALSATAGVGACWACWVGVSRQRREQAGARRPAVMPGAEGSAAAPEPEPEPQVLVLLFYKYVAIADVEALCADQRALCERLRLLGRVLIAAEGVNGTLSGPAAAVREYVERMSAHPLFSGVDWKTGPYQPAADGALPFPDLLVKQVKRIVSLGAADSVDPARGGTHLSPREFHEAVEGAAQGRDDVVVVDVRSTYEHAIGHFEGAAPLLPSALL